MLEIRIHGRGGQGNVVAAYLLAAAAFEAGRHCQAFPAFGAERRGAPVTAFVRIAKKKIQRRNQVIHPHFLIVQDESLLQDQGLASGLVPGGGILINAVDGASLGRGAGPSVVALPGTRMAMETIGRPLPNVALLGAFLSLSGLMPLDALEKALSARFKGEVLDRNLELMKQAAAKVAKGSWKEIARASGA